MSESKPEEKPQEKQGEKNPEPEPQQANNQEVQKPAEEKPEPETGDKRKADEQADAPVTANGKADVEKEIDDAKKQKTENGTAAPAVAPATNGSKKGPGRPKTGTNGEKKAAKKEKKAPAVGRAERKTRSQGNAD